MYVCVYVLIYRTLAFLITWVFYVFVLTDQFLKTKVSTYIKLYFVVGMRNYVWEPSGLCKSDKDL